MSNKKARDEYESALAKVCGPRRHAQLQINIWGIAYAA
jgi:hypothetical protein